MRTETPLEEISLPYIKAKAWADKYVPTPNWDKSGEKSELEDIHQLNYRLRSFFTKAYLDGWREGQENVEDGCPHCGTTEILCGYNGAGCEKDPLRCPHKHTMKSQTLPYAEECMVCGKRWRA